MLQYLTSLLARGARLEAGAALAYAVHVGMDYRVKSGQSVALLCSIFVVLCVARLFCGGNIFCNML